MRSCSQARCAGRLSPIGRRFVIKTLVVETRKVRPDGTDVFGFTEFPCGPFRFQVHGGGAPVIAGDVTSGGCRHLKTQGGSWQSVAKAPPVTVLKMPLHRRMFPAVLACMARSLNCRTSRERERSRVSGRRPTDPPVETHTTIRATLARAFIAILERCFEADRILRIDRRGRDWSRRFGDHIPLTGGLEWTLYVYRAPGKARRYCHRIVFAGADYQPSGGEDHDGNVHFALRE